jgi:hypothetical protein
MTLAVGFDDGMILLNSLLSKDSCLSFDLIYDCVGVEMGICRLRFGGVDWPPSRYEGCDSV